MGEEISLLNILFLYYKTEIRYIFPTKLIKLYFTFLFNDELE